MFVTYFPSLFLSQMPSNPKETSAFVCPGYFLALDKHSFRHRSFMKKKGFKKRVCNCKKSTLTFKDKLLCLENHSSQNVVWVNTIKRTTIVKGKVINWPLPWGLLSTICQLQGVCLFFSSSKPTDRNEKSLSGKQCDVCRWKKSLRNHLLVRSVQFFKSAIINHLTT